MNCGENVNPIHFWDISDPSFGESERAGIGLFDIDRMPPNEGRSIATHSDWKLRNQFDVGPAARHVVVGEAEVTAYLDRRLSIAMRLSNPSTSQPLRPHGLTT